MGSVLLGNPGFTVVRLEKSSGLGWPWHLDQTDSLENPAPAQAKDSKMTLAADCFRCPGSRCPDFVREGCRRFVDLKAGVGPRTPYADASLKTVVTYTSSDQYLDRLTVETVAMDWSEGPCIHMIPAWDDS